MPEAKAQDNFTDPDSRIMKRAGGGFDASYNAQTAVDDTAHIIVAAELTNSASRRARIADDAGRGARTTWAPIPSRRWPMRATAAEAVFEALAAAAASWWWRSGARASSTAHRSRTLHYTAAMAAKLQTDEGTTAYRRRKWIAEPPNGWIKNVLGFRQFSLRGLHRVQAEWKLVCLALNLRRMATMQAA